MEENKEKKVKKQRHKSVNHGKNKNLTVEQIQEAFEKKQVFDALVQDVDNLYNLHMVFANKIPAIMPREEVSSIVGEDGLVEAKTCLALKDKVVKVCIKSMKVEAGEIKSVILSKRELELKVRQWMYINLKPGMKLKGVVRGLTDYAAFVDVGGGVVGMLRNQDICRVRIDKASDKLKYGQRIECIVKAFDKDTGKIDLMLQDVMVSFEQLSKQFNEGDIVEATVRNRSKTGIFIELSNGLVGMSEHVSGIEYGQKVLVHIRRINVEKEKIKLDIIG